MSGKENGKRGPGISMLEVTEGPLLESRTEEAQSSSAAAKQAAEV
jgi:hypothetical protein